MVEEELAFLRKRVAELEAEVRVLHIVRQPLHYQKKRRINDKFHPPLYSGLHVSINTTSEKVQWFRTRNPDIHRKLWSELLRWLPRKPAEARYTNDILLQNFFFLFSTGLSIEATSRTLRISGKTVSGKTVRRWFVLALKHFSAWGRATISFPSDDEWISDSKRIFEDETYSEYKDKLFFFVDGTVVKILNMSDPITHRAFHNGKHGCPGFVFFICVTPSGRIVYLSDLEGGSTHDKTHFLKSGVVKDLQNSYPTSTIEKNGVLYQRALGGDKAYPYAPKPDGWKWYITKTGEETRDVNPITGLGEGEVAAKNLKLTDVLFDPGFARLRAVVERVIAKIKEWPIFSHKQLLSSIKITRMVVQFAVGFINWMFFHGYYNLL